MPLPAISLDSLSASGGKPKDYYLIEFFRLYEKYWDEMTKSNGNDLAIDVATGMLLAFCPHKATREKMWDDYLKVKMGHGDVKGKGSLTASILAAGDFFTYLSDTLEFTEEAYAGG